MLVNAGIKKSSNVEIIEKQRGKKRTMGISDPPTDYTQVHKRKRCTQHARNKKKQQQEKSTQEKARKKRRDEKDKRNKIIAGHRIVQSCHRKCRRDRSESWNPLFLKVLPRNLNSVLRKKREKKKKRWATHRNFYRLVCYWLLVFGFFFLSDEHIIKSTFVLLG